MRRRQVRLASPCVPAAAVAWVASARRPKQRLASARRARRPSTRSSSCFSRHTARSGRGRYPIWRSSRWALGGSHWPRVAAALAVGLRDCRRTSGVRHPGAAAATARVVGRAAALAPTDSRTHATRATTSFREEMAARVARVARVRRAASRCRSWGRSNPSRRQRTLGSRSARPRRRSTPWRSSCARPRPCSTSLRPKSSQSSQISSSTSRSTAVPT
mmetsp:Transcript_52501/g.104352  ORF Transcript_52501/g.104352 Transcript_52501/m.104352 type:complete len:217 (+) Transcript_52501:176-826(+)